MPDVEKKSNEDIRKAAVLGIIDERVQQTKKWSEAHDDDHEQGQLAIAAARLLTNDTSAFVDDPYDLEEWGLEWKHRNSRVRQLEVAGALVVAELERELRAERDGRKREESNE